MAQTCNKIATIVFWPQQNCSHCYDLDQFILLQNSFLLKFIIVFLSVKNQTGNLQFSVSVCKSLVTFPTNKPQSSPPWKQPSFNAIPEPTLSTNCVSMKALASLKTASPTVTRTSTKRNLPARRNTESWWVANSWACRVST